MYFFLSSEVKVNESFSWSTPTYHSFVVNTHSEL
jgi:hypothetical protein